MSGVLILIGVIILAYKLIEGKSWDKEFKGKHDLDAEWKDCVNVSTGKLSKSEYKKRLKNGHYYK